MRKALHFITIALAISVLQGVKGATWYVDGKVPVSGDGTSWLFAFQKIQQGIDAASDGASTTWLDTRPPVSQKFYRIELSLE
jgi:hypothetical protein